ncbi:RNA-binding protein [Suttonella sp. R2A3]|uniref:RNA recognition motif domain-containing protein n=1 Tax=Suttonella sp. R2A3 TaxID=2908648 RepID=UPI001F1E77F4|nr:RNA-binding protein [Suttonella sp. R2A3]UJF23641.1 RNA-binding protein [Suttonella sp. R2A3]
MTNIYVGNLSYQTDENELRNIFSAHGEVSSANIITDRDSGRSKGFGFVEMPDAEAAKKAIEAVNGAELGGRNLRVNEARPKEDRPRRSFNRDKRW